MRLYFLLDDRTGHILQICLLESLSGATDGQWWPTMITRLDSQSHIALRSEIGHWPADPILISFKYASHIM